MLLSDDWPRGLPSCSWAQISRLKTSRRGSASGVRKRGPDHMVLSWSALSCRVRIALSLKKEEYSLTDSRYYCSPFLKEWSGLSRVAIPVKRKSYSLFGVGLSFRTQIRTGKGQLFSKI